MATLQAWIEAYAAQSSDPFLAIAKLTHSTFASDIRLVANFADLSSSALDASAQTFTKFPFRITFPESADTIGSASFVVDAIGVPNGKGIVEQVRAIAAKDGAITVDIALVLLSDPNTAQIRFPTMKWTDISWDRHTVQGSLGGALILDTPLQAVDRRFTPGAFPSLF